MEQIIERGFRIIQVAEKEIGTKESPANSNKTKYGAWAKYNGVPWCALFVSKCYYDAGFPLPKIGFAFNGFAGCQTGYAYFKKMGWLTDKPIAGDIVLYDWNADGRYDHTGVFERWVDKDCFNAIEGNTSHTNNSNGGEVMLRTRNKKVAVFAHPIL